MYPINSSPPIVFKFKRLTLAVISILILGSAMLPVQAQLNSDASELQALAQTYAEEFGGAFAGDRWTRVEFGQTYSDPVVVIEPFIANQATPYLVGIRNIDGKGFEVSLRNCDGINTTPQQNVNFSVLESSSIDRLSQTKQVFAWGECPT